MFGSTRCMKSFIQQISPQFLASYLVRSNVMLLKDST
jgi:hypothetical protein